HRNQDKVRKFEYRSTNIEEVLSLGHLDLLSVTVSNFGFRISNFELLCSRSSLRSAWAFSSLRSAWGRPPIGALRLFIRALHGDAILPPLRGGRTRAGGSEAEHGSDAEHRNQDKVRKFEYRSTNIETIANDRGSDAEHRAVGSRE
ncbi:MAG: hypothetical protein J7J91_00610, partial [Deltaproteobacteria bacterium]|nr:hypothetical protein [Deltaproteobacteria bacterium]